VLEGFGLHLRHGREPSTDIEKRSRASVIVNNNTVFIFIQLVPFCVFQMVPEEVSGIMVIYRR
jgi:hypothetical protein